MAKNTKTKRTEIKDLAAQQPLSEKEMKELKGGTVGDPIGGIDVGLVKKCSCGLSRGHSGNCRNLASGQ